MKRFVLVASLMLALCLQAVAQEPARFSHQLQIGAGVAHLGGADHENGLAVSIGYGLDIRLTEHLSVMPSVDCRLTSGSLLHGGMAGGFDADFSFLDCGVALCYHCLLCDKPVTFGVGPYWAHALSRDEYYIDSDPFSPLNGCPKIRPDGFGLMPSGQVQLSRHFALGVTAHIGLTDMAEYYSCASFIEAWRISSLQLQACFCF